MQVIPAAIPDVLIIEPKVFGDARGFFLESWNETAFLKAGIRARFVQDNHSRSARNAVRGLHYLIKRHAKLIVDTRGVYLELADNIVKD